MVFKFLDEIRTELKLIVVEQTRNDPLCTLVGFNKITFEFILAVSKNIIQRRKTIYVEKKVPLENSASIALMK